MAASGAVVSTVSFSSGMGYVEPGSAFACGTSGNGNGGVGLDIVRGGNVGFLLVPSPRVLVDTGVGSTERLRTDEGMVGCGSTDALRARKTIGIVDPVIGRLGDGMHPATGTRFAGLCDRFSGREKTGPPVLGMRRDWLSSRARRAAFCKEGVALASASYMGTLLAGVRWTPSSQRPDLRETS